MRWWWWFCERGSKRAKEQASEGASEGKERERSASFFIFKDIFSFKGGVGEGNGCWIVWYFIVPIKFSIGSQKILKRFPMFSIYVPQYISNNSITTFLPQSLSSFHLFKWEPKGRPPNSMVCIWRIETFTLGSLQSSFFFFFPCDDGSIRISNLKLFKFFFFLIF